MSISYERIVPVSKTSTEAFKTGLWGRKKPFYREGVGPCREACPCGIDIPYVLSRVSEGDFDGALRWVLLENPFPGICGRVCYHPCELSCNRGQLDESVSIRNLERAISEYGTANPQKHGFSKQKRVAIVGAGPAGLSCAYFLLMMGYKVSIYEKEGELGGLLRYGIPPYRLPKRVLDMELQRLLSLQPEVHTGVEVDAYLLGKLLDDYDYVFLALGLQEPRRLGVEGEQKQGVVYGLPFLKGKLQHDVRGQRAVVIGGGDVAMDVARKLVRMDPTRKVSIYAPETLTELPALKENLAETLEEGVEIEGGMIPVSIEGDGRVESVKFVDAKVERDPSTCGLRFLKGENMKEVQADLVVICIGQIPKASVLGSEVLDQRGFVFADPYGRTKIERLFAGGDMVGLRAAVADAIASGKRAAMAIDMELRGCGELELPFLGQGRSPSFSHYLGLDRKERKKVIPFKDLNTVPIPFSPSLKAEKEAPEERRKDFREVSKRITQERAKEEAGRCLSCGLCKGCDLCFLLCPDVCVLKRDERSFFVKEEYCKACGVCARVCPCNVLEMVDRP